MTSSSDLTYGIEFETQTGETLLARFTPASAHRPDLYCDQGLLICHIGDEIHGKPFISPLSGQLSQRGIPSLSIDFSGSKSGSVDQLRARVHGAANELRKRSGLERIACLGIGLAGLISFLAEVEDPECPLLILLNPVLNGQDHLKKLERKGVHNWFSFFQKRAEKQADSFDAQSFESGAILASLDISTYSGPLIPALVLISTEEVADYDRFVGQLRAKNAVVRREVFSAEVLKRVFDVIVEEILL